MQNGICVGGTVLANHRMVRLLVDDNGTPHPHNTPVEIGQIWDIAFASRTKISLPHVEDVVIQTAKLIRNIENLNQYILDHRLVDWNGSIENAFDGLLSWTSAGSGFIPYGGQYPSKSTGFWVSDIDLHRSQYGESIKYIYSAASIVRRAKFIGYQNQLAIIPAGTIVRLSLSRRFSSSGNDGFWLQISGWY